MTTVAEERRPHGDEERTDLAFRLAPPVWRRWPYRIAFALTMLLVVVVIGGASVWVSGEGEYTIFESLYFSLITVSTVGYGELPHLRNHAWARTISATTIVVGMIVLSLFQATLTALFIDGVVGKAVVRRRMNKAIESLQDHYIVVGCGRVGRYVAEELHRLGHAFVVIEQESAAVHHLEQEIKASVLYLEGNAAEDEVLQAAGIERAAGMVASLSLDRDNLFVTLSARTMNKQLRIITKVVNDQNEAKFIRAGADRTVSPQSIGGHRMAHELTRPEATAFFDNMMQVPKGVGFHDIFINHGCHLSGTSVKEARLRDDFDLLVVGFLLEDGSYDYNPDGDEMILAGSHLIVLGKADDVHRLRQQIAGSLA